MGPWRVPSFHNGPLPWGGDIQRDGGAKQSCSVLCSASHLLCPTGSLDTLAQFPLVDQMHERWVPCNTKY